MTTTATIAKGIILERRGAVGRLIINRPPLNILDLVTLGELRLGVDYAMNDPSVLLLEICGAGEKAFSAGTDVRDHFPERAAGMLQEFHELIRRTLYSKVPTIAIVRGHCLGGGMELALACDFILASSDAHFGLPEIKLGAFPPVAAVLLPRIAGTKKALEIILSGEPIAAHEAAECGIVNRVAEPAQLEERVSKFEEVLLAQSPLISRLARKAARAGLCEELECKIREAERVYLEELLPSEDATEGLKAFLEKRPPAWKSR